MGRTSTKPVLWLLKLKKVSNAHLIAVGFKPSTVYAYNSRWPTILKNYKAALKKLKELKKKNGNRN